MERQFPKNVKQIGNVSDSPRIYVEDYVETFLNQLEEQGREVTITAFLLGEKVQIEGEECIFGGNRSSDHERRIGNGKGGEPGIFP